jgi:glycosyltransferase involved in cell wall biosynthesis
LAIWAISECATGALAATAAPAATGLAPQSGGLVNTIIAGLGGPLGWVLLAACAIASMAMVMTLVNLKALGRAAGSAADWNDGVRAAAQATGQSAAAGSADAPLVTVCVPARNEAANLEACVRGILACEPALASALGATRPGLVEVMVYDDQSTDDTPRILARLCAEDSRVRAASVVPLAQGWNGKQHACWRMSREARGAWLAFTDADVRFAPSCLAAALARATDTKAALISAFPRQLTGSLPESLAVPMIFFILLSYLPFPRMRRTNDPSSSAGCGQFLLVRRDAYDASGGHEGFKDSMHDGIKMPRAVRRAGFHSDLVDGTDLLECRMYRGLGQTWRGFAKNAYEGLGSVGLLVFITVMHAIGHVLPWGVVVWWVVERATTEAGSITPQQAGLALAACGVALAQRVVLALRLRTSVVGALLHPVGVVMMTLIQWHSLYLHRTGKRAWRGRVAGAAAGP